MNRPLGGGVMLSVAAALVAVATSAATAQERKPTAGKTISKTANSAERASGVIVKVEPIHKGISSTSSNAREEPRGVRLTINTAAVWRDWVRDQVSENGGSSPKKESADGANSVATKGEPQSPATLVVVELVPASQVETRFRLPDDETSKGAKTPTAAREDDPDPAADTARSRATDTTRLRTRSAAKPVRFTTADLRPGLFVEVDFRPVKAGNVASTVTVIRPVSPTDRPARPAAK